jgi:DNA-binding IscR family transcriptional regulator
MLELAIIDCLQLTGHYPRKKICILKDYWSGLNETIRISMGSQNLQDLVDKTRAAEAVVEAAGN